MYINEIVAIVQNFNHLPIHLCIELGLNQIATLGWLLIAFK